MDGIAAGSSSGTRWRGRAISGEDIVDHPFLFLAEPLGLQVEHRPVAAAKRHEFVVAAQLAHTPVCNHAEAVSQPHRGEAVRYQDGGAVPRRLEDAFEDL